MNKIPIALFRTRGEAEPVRERLSEAGISSELHEEVWLQKLWFVSKDAAGVTLEVPEDQFQRAEQLILTMDKKGTLQAAVHCPECHSLLVDYPQFARNSVMTNIAAGLLAEVGLLERDYYCEHCHYTWPKQGGSGSKRQHLAPYYFIEDVPAAAAKQ